MKIESLDINELIPYANNAKEHPDSQINQIAGSIAEFGFNDPIAIDEKNIIIEGHGRLLAAKKLKLKEVPIIRLSHLTDVRKKAYIIAHNKLTMNTGFDFDILDVEMEFLNDNDIDFNILGFDDDEISEFFDENIDDGNIDDDEIPDIDETEPKIKLGDLIELGNHRVLCGDSTKNEDVERLMRGVKADMVFTDPPYNINYGNNKHRKIKNDNMSKDSFVEFCRLFAGNIKNNCDGIVYCWAGSGPDGRIMFTELDNILHNSTVIVWNKHRFIIGRGKYQSKHEFCWFGWNKSGNSFTDDRTLNNVWEFKAPLVSKLHPTMKPVEIVENALHHSSSKKDIVLDLFLGSGSTLIACEKTNRKCYGMELDEHYCDVIIERYCQYSDDYNIKINSKSINWRELRESNE